MWMKQVSLGLVAAFGSLVAVYATTARQSVMTTPPVSRLVDLGSNKTIAEGAGAAGLAACLNKKTDLKLKKTISMICGGNIDLNIL